MDTPPDFDQNSLKATSSAHKPFKQTNLTL